MTQPSAPPRRNKARTAVLCLGMLAALAIGAAGVAKFIPSTPWQRFFVNWGYPPWFALVVGAVEVAGAILALVPRAAFYGAALLASVMMAAGVTLFLHRNVPPGWTPTTNLAYLAVLAAFAAARWRDRARRSPSILS
jgi:uncharacterized membrane protein YphA (DoxX/SURF4 family)